MNQKRKVTPPTLVVRRLIHARRERVFEAWTNPESMKAWFFPGNGRAEVTSIFRVGGTYSNRMFLTGTEACSESAAETKGYLHTGEYLEILPPEKIVFTWNSHIVTNSRVTIELFERGDATELLLTHELLETEDLRQKHNEGWGGCITNLERFLA